jgi:hypothetical protein
MSLITINIDQKINERPTSGEGLLDLDHNELYVFVVDDFNSNTVPQYFDPENDPIEAVKITRLPSTGTISLGGSPISVNDEISAIAILSGGLTYQADPAVTGAYVDINMLFTVSDEGSSLFSSVPQRFTFSVGKKINLAPTAVGDGSADVGYGLNLVFTRAMFTSSTTPPYSDPEGDAALLLQVVTLPTLGKIKLDGEDITPNQVIDFSDIDAGLLVYVPDLSDIDGDLQNFTFGVADAGSGIFVF